MLFYQGDSSLFFVEKPANIAPSFFQAFQMDKKYKSVFRPAVILDLNSHKIVIEGYKPVWAYLDSLFPNDPLPRATTNSIMKSEAAIDDGEAYENWGIFLDDLEAFHGESSVRWVGIGAGQKRPNTGILRGFLGTFYEGGFMQQPTKDFIINSFNETEGLEYLQPLYEALKRLDLDVQMIQTPWSDRDDLTMVQTIVIGVDNAVMFCQAIPQPLNGQTRIYLSCQVQLNDGTVIRPVQGSKIFAPTMVRKGNAVGTILDRVLNYILKIKQTILKIDYDYSPEAQFPYNVYTVEQDQMQYDLAKRCMK